MPYPCGWFTNVLKPSFPVWFFVADCFPAIVTVTDQIDLPVVQLLFPFCLSWETYNHRTVEEGKDHLPLRWQSKGCIHSLLHCHVTHGLISRKPGFIPFSLQVQFKALSLSPADYCVNILFPLWERFICLQQAWCCDQSKSAGEPGLDLGICLLALSAYFLLFPYNLNDRRKYCFALDPLTRHTNALSSFWMALGL